MSRIVATGVALLDPCVTKVEKKVRTKLLWYRSSPAEGAGKGKGKGKGNDGGPQTPRSGLAFPLGDIGGCTDRTAAIEGTGHQGTGVPRTGQQVVGGRPGCRPPGAYDTFGRAAETNALEVVLSR